MHELETEYHLIDAEKFKEDIKCLESGLRKKNNC